MNKKTIFTYLVVFLGAAALAACTAGPNSVVNTPGLDENPAGFWLGLWHGMISAVTFVVGLFEPSVRAYEVHNNGNWYDLGFLLGVGAFARGSSAAVEINFK